MPAYQIQVQGLLDGATPFVLPDEIPSPSDGGVIKIDAGAGVDVGTFDLNALAGTDATPVWVRAFHVEFAAATRAARFQGDVSGSLARETIAPVVANAVVAPLMRPNIITSTVIQPIGTELDILTDDTDDSFAGAPVAGPHFIYIDVEPITSDEQMALIQDLAAFAVLKADGQSQQASSFQAVAATATEQVQVVSLPSPGSRTVAQGQLVEASVSWGGAAAAGESMVIDVRRIRGGVITTIATITLDNTNAAAANGELDIPIVVAENELISGDLIDIQRTYVAGGGPTMTSTIVQAKVAAIQIP